ncbi:peptide arylation enzyme [Mycolicibacterium phlei]|jgi:mycobactin salicyl-AMP ligase|uniref:Enterobactin synthase subunit E n=1 Tax=Mycolicibacterium phlei DSM 43239 = CCUG 21000 TaxID=1226750 RepID=A0A5N5V8T1_MYCPH|nr:AMP-binding protein [Mycolicibacterium phlei]VEG10394.1 peptide arylation enzyme [Mycobacteroides chelonae]AMO62292.1 2,3-dihydroxybenzoate-AMP ligase [Mycolicibacterium phlei]KAB7757377.1 enterobactin synthase subunit E [Mycolicibacterium phlei DSM 43239 = CCUG 21000]KXW66274.1 enterobactin synthase subunit E [Mycolicibacterium phlei DSM 43239 = CCUG 21000]KXW70340.1 enterobactin synthase subunit E [Mycolicibacterium phlei DSM 43072]
MSTGYEQRISDVGDLLDGFVPFPPDRAAEYRRAGYWEDRPLDSILADAVAQWPDRTAIIDPEVSYTYAELDAKADRIAAALTARGLRPGDRVLVQLPNTCEFAVALFGVLRAALVPVMCLPGHRHAELNHFAAVSGAVALIVPDVIAGFDYRELAENLVANNPALRHVFVAGDPGRFESWYALADFDGPAPQRPPIDPDVPALLLVSGGTTGLPKLIARTHNDYVYTAKASAQSLGMTSDDVYLVVLPAGHNFPLGCPGLLGSMTVGAPSVFTADASPEACFALIDKYKVTVTGLVNALAKVWTQACEWEPVLPTSLRVVQVGGSRMTPQEAEYILDGLTPGLSQIFGMAEGMLNFTRPGDPRDVVVNTQGRRMSAHDEMRVVDENGDEVAPGEEGELLVRGPYTLNGYYRDPEANARSFTPDGFYRSGDRVRIFTDGPRAGYVEVTGRIKDVIHRGGETVSASDLEEHLFAHPAIYAAAAVPLPDEFLGEKICAAVVFKGAPITLAELNEFLDERGVSAHCRPDVLAALPSLPKTPVGKVDKKKVVAQLVDQD